MANPSLRQIAQDLGLSVATVSRALHQDPRVKPETARRVLEELRARDYHLDPTVSNALAQVRRRSFYRETLAWCSDVPTRDLPWLNELYEAAHGYAARLGYRIEHFHFRGAGKRELARLRGMWQARGIRGVLLGPFASRYEELPFKWDDLAWVIVGHTFRHEALQMVGRDYMTDINAGLEWLRRHGCRRPAFLVRGQEEAFMTEPMLHAALVCYHKEGLPVSNPLLDLDSGGPAQWRRWLKQLKPDGLVMTNAALRQRPAIDEIATGLPMVMLSAHVPRPGDEVMDFHPPFPKIGQSAVNVLHRLLRTREYGTLGYRQSVLISSE